MGIAGDFPAGVEWDMLPKMAKTDGSSLNHCEQDARGPIMSRTGTAGVPPASSLFIDRPAERRPARRHISTTNTRLIRRDPERIELTVGQVKAKSNLFPADR